MIKFFIIYSKVDGMLYPLGPFDDVMQAGNFALQYQKRLNWTHYEIERIYYEKTSY